jgi:AraC-like DNA-binding protein
MECSILSEKLTALQTSLDQVLGDLAELQRQSKSQLHTLLTPVADLRIAEWKAEGRLNASGRTLRNKDGTHTDVYDEAIKLAASAYQGT